MDTMPLLNSEELERLRNIPSRKCSDCGMTITQNYCRSCDAFYGDGHEPDCPRMKKVGPFSNDHRDCRTY